MSRQQPRDDEDSVRSVSTKSGYYHVQPLSPHYLAIHQLCIAPMHAAPTQFYTHQEGTMTGRVISMYELSGSVGRGGSNFTNDVMLIQYFLFSIYIGTVFSTPFEIVSTALKPAALVPMTGRFTPDIIPWIETFQQDANRKGLGPVVADGRVDAGKPAGA